LRTGCRFDCNCSCISICGERRPATRKPPWRSA
jgi:hypothetical protein